MSLLPTPRRLALFRSRMETQAGVRPMGAWIIHPANRRYLSGFKAEDSTLTESSGSLLITASEAVLVTDGRFTTQAQEETEGFGIHTLRRGLVEELGPLASDLGVERLGFEPHYVTWKRHQDLSQRLAELSPPMTLHPMDPWVERMREIKDEEEILCLSRSAELICRILEEIVTCMRPGMREREVAGRIETLAREAGAEALAFPPIVASGPRSALPHAVPTDRAIQEGEPVILDVGVRLEGYCSDVTRTVFLGEPSEEFKRIAEVVRAAQEAGLAKIRPGVLTDEVYREAYRVIDGAGYGERFPHSLGHGIGLEAHEGPRLGPREPVKLREGMVVTVEPGIYLPGRGGVRLEEMALVTAEGPRLLSRPLEAG